MQWKTLIAAALFVGAVSVADAGWRVGNKLIREGDTMAKVLRVAGQPDMKNRIESREGGTVGNRWYYVIEGYNAKTVIITFQGGRVVDIRRERE